MVYFSTRSVEMNLARRFNAGYGQRKYFRRLATSEVTIQPSLRDKKPAFYFVLPALKRRAKLRRRYAALPFPTS